MIKLIHGDSLDILKRATSNSIDTIITDPPYGLSFMGKKWDYDVPSVELWTECLRVLKPGGTALIFAGSRTQHRMAVNVEDAGFDIKDTILWIYGSGFPKATDISKQLDKVIGKQGKGFKTAGDDGRKAEFQQDKSFRSDYGYKWEPTGEEAKLWNGWKSHGLKPAYEPIIVAVKPNDGTYAANALKWGVSGLNIDGGRIGTEEASYFKTSNDVIKSSSIITVPNQIKRGGGHATGRFPANIILDEEAGDGEEWRRYFYCAKASKAERNAGCEGLPEKLGAECGIRTTEIGKPGGYGLPRPNHHPTVKPLKLMEYLCTLTKTPTGGRVLDPFMGSGTTGLACKNTGRDFVGIEREAEYIEIARARIEHA